MAEMAETPEKATPEQLEEYRRSMACLMTKTKTTPKTTSRR